MKLGRAVVITCATLALAHACVVLLVLWPDFTPVAEPQALFPATYVGLSTIAPALASVAEAWIFACALALLGARSLALVGRTWKEQLA